MVPSNVTSITCGNECNKTSFVLPDSVTFIGDDFDVGTYENNGNVTTIVLSNSLTYVGTYSMGGFETFVVPDLHIPASLRTVGNYSFYVSDSYSGGLTTFSIPASVTSIGEGAFRNDCGFNVTVDILPISVCNCIPCPAPSQSPTTLAPTPLPSSHKSTHLSAWLIATIVILPVCLCAAVIVIVKTRQSVQLRLFSLIHDPTYE